MQHSAKQHPLVTQRTILITASDAADAAHAADPSGAGANIKAAHRTAILPLGAMVAAMAFGANVYAQTATPPASSSTSSSTQQDAAKAETLPTINVNAAHEQPGYQAAKSTVGKGNQELRDIPQSVTVVTNQLIQDQNAHTLKEALRNVSNLSFNAGEGGRIGDNINLRGFSAYGDIYLDGMRDVAQYNRDTFNVDRVDVLRGSASMLFGRGSTGGIINQSSKMPFLGDNTEIEATYGSDDYKRATLDLNRKVGENAAFRLNLMKTNAGNFRDGAYSNSIGVAPSFSWGIDSENEFNLSYYHLSYKDVPNLGLPWYNNRPIHDASGIDVPVTRSYGFSNDWQNDSADIFSASWVHRFDNETSLKTSLRAGGFDRDLRATQATFKPSDPIPLLNSSLLTRGFQTRGGSEKPITLQSDFQTKLETGTIQHEILAGVELNREKADYFWYTRPALPSVTVANPGAMPAFPENHTIDPIRAREFSANSVGVYAQDMIALTPHWKILAGARFDSMDADYHAIDQKTLIPFSTNRRDNVWSYRTGIIYQPTDTQSYYASYGTSFNPSADTYVLDPMGSNTPPEKSRNIEIGAKWDLLDGNLMLRTALFRTEKTNERNTDLESSPDEYLLSGKRHTDGIEFEMAGRLTPEWEIFAGYSPMRASVDISNTGNQGMRPDNTPTYTANLWSTYKLGHGWRVGGGFNSVGQRILTRGITKTAPGYTRWDALVEYAFDKYTIKLNVFNLFNKEYADALYPAFYVPGTDRAAQLTLSYKF